MHPELIKAAIRMKGTSPTALAETLDVAPTSVFDVINGRTRSSRIEEAISALVGKKKEEIWPANNAPKINRRRARGAK